MKRRGAGGEGRRHRWFNGTFGVLAVFVTGLATPAEAQLFREGGLFNRDRQEPLGPPKDPGIPHPKNGNGEAVKGVETTFVLKADAKTPAALVEFMIRDFPQAGQVVSLVSNPGDRHSAIVTYRAEPGSGATTDAFTFAVRYRNGRMSPMARFDIDLVETRSQIEVTQKLEFGEVRIGEEKILSMQVRNGGGVALIRQLMPAPPWHVVEPPQGRLSVPPGGLREVKIAFRPTLPGETRYILPVSRSKAGLCEMSGSGVVPFSIVGDSIELSHDPETGRRTGEVVLKNEGARPLLVTVFGSTRLKKSLGEEVILRPRGETRKTIYLTETDVAAFDGGVEFSYDRVFNRMVRVSAPPVPGKLRVSIPQSLNSEVLNFGQVEGGRSTERGIVVHNDGGVPISLSFEVDEPFRVVGRVPDQVAPRASVPVAIGFFPLPDRTGLTDLTMAVLTDAERHDLRLLGNVTRPKNLPRFSLSRRQASPPEDSGRAEDSVPGGGGTPPEADRAATGSTGPAPGAVSFSPGAARDEFRVDEEQVEQVLGEGARLNPAVLDPDWRHSVSDEERATLTTDSGFEAMPMVQREVDPSVRGAEDLEVVSTGVKTITLGWTAPPDSEYFTFEVETMGMAVIDGEHGATTRPAWLPVREVEFERIGRLVKATVQVPSPAADYHYRVITTDENGRHARPTNPIVATTDAPMDWTWIYATLGLLLVSGLGFGVVRVIRDRRPEVYRSQYVEP